MKPKTPKPTVLQRYDQLKKEQKEKIKADIEYQQRPVIHKDRKRKRYQSSSDEELGVVEVKGEKPIISTRKSQQKQKADEILNDPDPGEFFPCEIIICVNIRVY